ncbi:MAG: EscU/YscU/HrcU family type III secretion system export apparatus switch protein [Desulfurispora sp.]|uniref:EscU/YscU/HrcU family type III secretion system export apparatus switch protein n=1 Tax=Desulfurispora sp. TaxID=3014275 RepID=UPI00404AA627
MSGPAEQLKRQNSQQQLAREKTQAEPTVAAALRYDPGQDNAPLVVASGRGEMARRIIDTARQHGVAIYQDEQLAKTLLKLPVGQEIPPALYQAVAQVLVYLAGLDRELQQKYAAPAAPRA